MKATEADKSENLFSPEVWAQFKKVKHEFSRSIAPQIRENAFFSSNTEKKTRKGKRSRKNNRPSYFIDLPPLAASLTRDSYALQKAAQAVVGSVYSSSSAPSFVSAMAVEREKIVSVFVILEFQTKPVVKYHLQKIEKKSRPGLPGGGIKENESVLAAGAREISEETSANPVEGIDISKYNPVEIGTFSLNGALNGERGVILWVKLPETEISRIKPGGGDKEEGEIVTHVYLATSEQMEELISQNGILTNSQTVWQVFKKFRRLRI